MSLNKIPGSGIAGETGEIPGKVMAEGEYLQSKCENPLMLHFFQTRLVFFCSQATTLSHAIVHGL